MARPELDGPVRARRRHLQAVGQAVKAEPSDFVPLNSKGERLIKERDLAQNIMMGKGGGRCITLRSQDSPSWL